MAGSWLPAKQVLLADSWFPHGAGTHARHHVKVVCSRRAFQRWGAFPRVSGGCTRVISAMPRCTKRNKCHFAQSSERHDCELCNGKKHGVRTHHTGDKTFVTAQRENVGVSPHTMRGCGLRSKALVRSNMTRPVRACRARCTADTAMLPRTRMQGKSWARHGKSHRLRWPPPLGADCRTRTQNKQRLCACAHGRDKSCYQWDLTRGMQGD